MNVNEEYGGHDEKSREDARAHVLAVWHSASSSMRWSSKIASTTASAEATWDRKGGWLCPSWRAAHSLISSRVHPTDRFEGLPALDRPTFSVLGFGFRAKCAENMIRNVKDKYGTPKVKANRGQSP